MNKLSLIFLAVLIAMAVPVSAGTGSLDSSALVEKNAAIGGRAYTPQCLSDCHLVLEIRPNANADLAKSAADSFKSSFVKGSALKSGCIAESHYEIWTNQSYQATAWKADVKCSVVNNKTTGKDENVCVDNGKNVAETQYRMAWLPIDQAKPSKAGTYYVDLVAKRKLGADCANVDAVPTVYGQELKQYAWWNNAWEKKKRIFLTEASGTSVNGYQRMLNITYDADMNADFSDLRFLDSAETAELKYWIEDFRPGAFADVWVKADMVASTNTTVYMYYKNAAATTTSSAVNTMDFYDDFEDGLTTGWNPDAGTWSAASHYLEATDAADSTASYIASGFNESVNKRFSYMAYQPSAGNFEDETCIYAETKTYTDAGNVIVSLLNVMSRIRNSSTWTTYADIATILPQNTWKRFGATQFKGNYTLYMGAEAKSGSGFSDNYKFNYILLHTGYTTAGYGWDNITVSKYVYPEPEIYFGAEEDLPSANMRIYGNTTNGFGLYNGAFFSTNITVTNNTPAASITNVTIEFNGANHSTVNFGSGKYNWNTTLAGLTIGAHEVRQYAQNGSIIWETNSSTYFSIEARTGLELHDYNAGNGTDVGSWSVYITNGTAAYSKANVVGGQFINQSLLPYGTVNVTFYNISVGPLSRYKNDTQVATVSDTLYSIVNGRQWLYQQFRLKDTLTGLYVNPFTLTANNGTVSKNWITTFGELYIPLDEVPFGPTLFTMTGTGYGINSTTLTVNGSSEHNISLSVKPAGIRIQIFDEKTLAPITANLTISNATASWTISNIIDETILASNTSLPIGPTSFTFSKMAYGQRVYYDTISTTAFVSKSYYMLALTDGSYARFHILTVTDSAIPGALVAADKIVGGTAFRVAEQLTDGSGTAMLFLDPLVSYTIAASRTGYSSSSITINPSLSDYTIRLFSGTTTNVSTQFSDIWWQYLPSGCGYVNSTAQLFNFTITSSNSSLVNYGLNITVNETLMFSGTGTNAAGGSINATLNLANYSGTVLTSVYWFNKTGYPVYTGRTDCNIFANRTTNTTLYSVLMDMGANVCPVKLNKMGILWCPPLNILTLLVAMFVGAIATAKFTTFNGGGLAAAGVLWMAVFIGWWPMQVAFILTLASIAVIVLRGGTGG